MMAQKSPRMGAGGDMLLGISKKRYTKEDWMREEKEDRIMMAVIMTPFFATIVLLLIMGIKLIH